MSISFDYLKDWIYCGLAFIAVYLLINFFSGYGLYDMKRQHRTMSDLIAKSSRGEKERYQLSELHRVHLLLYIFIGIITLVMLAALYTGRK